MQNRDDVDGIQRPTTSDAPEMNTPANDSDLGGHMGAGGDPAEGDEASVEGDLAQNSPAKE